MRTAPFALLVALSALASFGGACAEDGGGSGGGSTSGGTGGVDDGKVHPPTNGVAIAESAACTKVESAFRQRMTELGCAATARSCPGLIQAPSGAPSCAQYDEGTADGCADHVRAGADCDDVRARLDICVVAFVSGSEPAGCD